MPALSPKTESLSEAQEERARKRRRQDAERKRRQRALATEEVSKSNYHDSRRAMLIVADAPINVQ